MSCVEIEFTKEGFIVWRDGVLLPGKYETEEAASHAVHFTREYLQSLADASSVEFPITICDLYMEYVKTKNAPPTERSRTNYSMSGTEPENTLMSKDNVNHPKHYNQGSIECIDAITAATVNKTGIEAFCVANVIKYLWRCELKNGEEDVKKAQWYLNRLLTELENQHEPGN